MTLSVVIPTFNSAETIIRAVHSVRNQTRAVDEIIVVDDGSTDDSCRILEQLKLPTLTIIRTRNRGVEHARNTGILASRSSHIAFLDADDVWESVKCEKQMLLLSKNPNLAAVSTYGYYLINDRRIGTINIGISDNEQLSAVRQKGKPVWMLTPSVIVRRDVFESVEMFRPCFDGAAEDLDLWTRIAYAFDVQTVPVSLVGVQIRLGSASMQKQRKMEENTAYIRECSKAMANGQQLPDLSSFHQSLLRRSLLKRFLSSRAAYGATQFREGSLYLLSGKYFGGFCKLFVAAICNPRHSFRKIAAQMSNG